MAQKEQLQTSLAAEGGRAAVEMRWSLLAIKIEGGNYPLHGRCS